jgi:hypothetical protein
LVKGCKVPYHYFFHYPDSEWLRAHASHSFSLEGLILQALHRAGKLCIVQDPTDVTNASRFVSH